MQFWNPEISYKRFNHHESAMIERLYSEEQRGLKAFPLLYISHLHLPAQMPNT
jgi:hypothetical protein